MKLIYRGLTFECNPPPIQPYRKPRAMNWRFRMPGETYEDTPRPIQPYRKPRAINWRFRMPGEVYEF